MEIDVGRWKRKIDIEYATHTSHRRGALSALQQAVKF